MMQNHRLTPLVQFAAKLTQKSKRQFSKAWLLGLTLLFVGAQVHAGILSKNLCKPYRSLVDNELFVTIGVIVGALLVIAWKLAPSGSYLQKGVGLLAGVAIALNLENIMQTAFGTGLAC